LFSIEICSVERPLEKFHCEKSVTDGKLFFSSVFVGLSGRLGCSRVGLLDRVGSKCSSWIRVGIADPIPSLFRTQTTKRSCKVAVKLCSRNRNAHTYAYYRCGRSKWNRYQYTNRPIQFSINRYRYNPWTDGTRPRTAPTIFEF
jgi:hypothetical protein